MTPTRTDSDAVARAAAGRAPYISFGSLLRVLEVLREPQPRAADIRQIVEAIDKSSATHRLAALRFLGLLDDRGRPAPELGRLLRAIGTAAWPEALALTISRAYEPLMAPDLACMTQEQFRAAFARRYAGSEAVLRKSRRFFVHAAIQARMPLSPSVVRAAKPRAGDRIAAVPRRLRPAAEGRDSGSPALSDDGADRLQPSESLAVRLLSELDTLVMDDEVKQAFWTLMRHIKDRRL